MNRIARKTGLATMALTLSLGMAACGSDSSSDSSSDPSSSASDTSTPSDSPSTPADTSSASGAADGTFGAGCANIPTDPSDPGSFEGMASQPVATAASGNPLLKTLVAAVTKAGLVDTLNSAKDITVFAPTDDAFAKIPPKTLKKVLKDKKTLTAILTHHVVPQTLTPDNLAGTFQTLNKDELTVKGSGDAFTAGTDGANIICGNITTANAKVYVVDSVLMPPM